jgi:hypothetical protein
LAAAAVSGRGAPHRLVVRGHPHRDRALDGRPQRPEIIGEVTGGEAGLDRRHAAADVDADCRRRHRVAHRHHRPHGRPLAEVDVGHHRDVVDDPGEGRDLVELRARLGLDARGRRPGVDGDVAAGDNGERHGQTITAVASATSAARPRTTTSMP